MTHTGTGKHTETPGAKCFRFTARCPRGAAPPVLHMAHGERQEAANATSFESPPFGQRQMAPTQRPRGKRAIRLPAPPCTSCSKVISASRTRCQWGGVNVANIRSPADLSADLSWHALAWPAPISPMRRQTAHTHADNASQCHEGAMRWAATQPAPHIVTTRSRARARHMLSAICRVAYTPQLNGPTPERSQNSSKRSLSCSRMRWRSSSRSSFCCSHLSHSSTES